MNIKEKLQSPVSLGNRSTSSKSYQQSINFAYYGKTTINKKGAVIGIICIIILAGIFSKYAVINRLSELNHAQRQVSSLKTNITECYQILEEYDAVKQKYAHYTYADLSEEEMNLPDRNKVLSLIYDVVMKKVEVTSFALNGSVLTMDVQSSSLESVNNLAASMENEDIVSYCSVQTANKQTGKKVEVTLTVYLEAGGQDDETIE